MVNNAAARNEALARDNFASVVSNHLKRLRNGNIINPGAARDTATATEQDFQSVMYVSKRHCPGGEVLPDLYLLQVSQPPGHPYVLAMNTLDFGE